MGLSNIPSDKEVDNLKALCKNVLEPVRVRYRVAFSPSSGYRSPALNDAIGGSSKSQHTKGEAVDFEVPHVSNLQVARWIESNLLFDQLILEHYVDTDPNSGWIHVSYTGTLSGNRRDVLRFDGVEYRHGIGDGETEAAFQALETMNFKMPGVTKRVTDRKGFVLRNFTRDFASLWSK
tara:strand:- start:68 stop:601 length:534 start_codon:yes stop_codon:yes gene_type:complete